MNQEEVQKDTAHLKKRTVVRIEVDPAFVDFMRARYTNVSTYGNPTLKPGHWQMLNATGDIIYSGVLNRAEQQRGSRR